ncbi:AraC family transcriptional regulator [Anseongella ginsenosidimutans]|uniref:AraC family transcriptional regulator n=1 Tax=Anseongella ginsenosidimutans TaxID=496056 RepID=A0A4R3KV60_9SPHI|nr:AraC family transcriptional regulator [Anseongella ginsenosidimutans]QEC53375.1 helix-turn-helix domain-containing protein [Anseongella ginsenosidimutans]TCS88259.1 AraC family transcriptional regulator [Anseongella ginsenosidimutans]
MADKIYIKNMVCPRCVKVVREELEKLGLPLKEVELGETSFTRELTNEELGRVRGVLEENGFELLEDSKQRLVAHLKTLIIEMVNTGIPEKKSHENNSDYLARKLGHDYNYLSSLFSTAENLTIERYIILQKIERVKELLAYGELSLSEIAYQLDYSSIAHLSSQFKKVTGLSPSHFKKIGEKRKGRLLTT